MEPERKIEKWLRAYAKKRHSQAKADFKLHPATRRLLQDEIARNTTKPEEEGDSISIWRLMRQQWAFLLGLAVCIFLLGAIILPLFNSPGKKTRTLSLNQPAQLGSPVKSLAYEDKTEQSLAYNPTTNSVTAFAETPVNSANLQVLKTWSSQASMPTSALAVAPAQPPPAVMAGSSVFGLPRKQAPTTIPVLGDSIMTISGRETVETTSSSPLASPGFDFSAQNDYKNKAILLQKARILVYFRVTQNGDNLQIVDQDGSIYKGFLLAVNEPGVNEGTDSTAQMNIVQQRPVGGGGFGGGGGFASDLSKDSRQAMSYYFFRVNGTNRTLNQNVVFSGRLLANIVETKNLQDNLAVSSGLPKSDGFIASQMKSEMTNQPEQLLWPNLRIRGIAVVNNTNQIEINAAPAPLELKAKK